MTSCRRPLALETLRVMQARVRKLRARYSRDYKRDRDANSLQWCVAITVVLNSVIAPLISDEKKRLARLRKNVALKPRPRRR